jgi:hypothetical protein
MTIRRKSSKRKESFAAGVGRGMRRAARTAREVARMHGTLVMFNSLPALAEKRAMQKRGSSLIWVLWGALGAYRARTVNDFFHF